MGGTLVSPPQVLPPARWTASASEALLEPMLVGDIAKVADRFFVPAYQRGYRWGEAEVRRLLDDIWESRDRAYYLQPVVVKPHGQEWEVVDGQQRLTTLFLIMQYMLNEGLQSSGAGYRMRYATREDSAAYLQEVGVQGDDVAKSQKNIDFFHISEAYRCISVWFAAHDGRRQYVANKLYDAFVRARQGHLVRGSRRPRRDHALHPPECRSHPIDGRRAGRRRCCYHAAAVGRG